MTEQIISERLTRQGSGKRWNRLFNRGGHRKALVHDKTDYFREAVATMAQVYDGTHYFTKADATKLKYMTEQIISERLTPLGSVI